jgi:V/A-type H+-transporting ATPase subunit C
MVGGLDAIRYASTSAYVRGLYSRLLSEATWRDLLHAEGLDAAISLLRATPYSDAISAVEQSGGLSLERIERALAGKVAANCYKAMAFVGGAARRLVKVWWQHFELENLKVLFRGLDQGTEPDVIHSLLIPLGEHSTLPWDVLLHESSVSGLIERLRDTHYINPLRAAFRIYQREHTPFALEVAMDIRYYRDVAAAIKDLGGTEREEARLLFGTRLDILNVLWAYRYRVYYNLSAEEIINYTLWRTFRTDINLVRDIALGAAPSDVLIRVWGEDAFDQDLLAELSDEAQMMPKLEMLLQRY